MAKVSPVQSSFAIGEVSPLFKGRVDLEPYRAALETCENYIPTVQGGLIRRPGTQYVGEVKDSTKKTRIIPFEYSTTQTYVVELSPGYLRVWSNYALVTMPRKSPSPPTTELTTPYVEADLFELKFAQSADYLVITHPSYPPYILRRGVNLWSTQTWAFESTVDIAPPYAVTVLNGPYMAIDDSGITLQCVDDGAGNVVVTASSALFSSSDHVGHWVRVKHPTSGDWIDLYMDTKVSNTVYNTVRLSGSTAETFTATVWRMGLWGTKNGYPTAVTFHEDRLVFGGVPGFPQRIDGSNSGDYMNFAPSDADGVIAASNAYSFTLNSNDVNLVRWLTSDEKGLLVGTVGGEWVIKGASSTEALSATNVSAKRTTSFGSADIQAVQAGKAALFLQRANRKIREMIYNYDIDGHKAVDLSVFSEHITEGGINQTTHQREPQSILWMVRADGKLVGMNYSQDLDGLKVGWHAHTLGGVSDTGGNPAIVESVCAIAAPDGLRDELYLVVKRRINGATKRFLEVMTKAFDASVATEDAWYVDCGLKYDSTPATTISGLSHLEGQTVKIWADGVEHAERTVTSGAITLSAAASVVIVGLNIRSRGKMLPLEAGAADGTALGKTRRTHRVGVLLHRTQGFKLGMSFDDLYQIDFGTGDDLFTGVISENVNADYDFYNQICWEQTGPSPGTILAIMPQMVTQDR